MKKVKSLYTPKDVQEARRELFDINQGVDPILYQKIDWKDAVLDHDHLTQHCRAAIHRQSNAFEGLVVNAHKRCLSWLTNDSLPDILRRLANYLEKDYSHNPYHNGWIKRVCIDFSKLNAEQQLAVLKEMQVEPESNATKRKAQFKKLINSREFDYESIVKLMKD